MMLPDQYNLILSNGFISILILNFFASLYLIGKMIKNLLQCSNKINSQQDVEQDEPLLLKPNAATKSPEKITFLQGLLVTYASISIIVICHLLYVSLVNS